MRLFFAVLLAVSGQEPPTQPDRWPKINSTTYQYRCTKSFFLDKEGHGSAEYYEFYSRYNHDADKNDQVMSIRLNGIYTTAYWDRTNNKAHFVYNKYFCDSTILPNPPRVENEPLEFVHPVANTIYYFFPELVALDSETMVTDVKNINDLSGIVVRNRPAWGWTANMHLKDEKGNEQVYDMNVYYSIPATKDALSVPIRTEIYLDRKAGIKIVNEMFDFQTSTLPDSIFQLPELAPCKTSHSPSPPSMTDSFHAKMEITDRIGHELLWPIYNLNIHYSKEMQLSNYIMTTDGTLLENYFGKTLLHQVTDFDSDLVFVMDKLQGNCSIYSIDPDDADYPASDIWYHGGSISMRNPEWFWHIPHPDSYWYKGETVTRNIGSERWAFEPEFHDTSHPKLVFEWEFANSSYAFFEGDKPYHTKVRQQPLLLKTRKVDPEENGHHHHTDYSIYSYTTSEKHNSIDKFDVSMCYFGEHHEFIQFNITDMDDSGKLISNLYYEEFKLMWVQALATFADVSIIRVTRFRTVGLGHSDELFMQFYVLDKYPTSKAKEQTKLLTAVDNIVSQVNAGNVTVDMGTYTAISSRFKLVPYSLSRTEFIDYNVVYQTKTVIDGYPSSSFAALTISTIIIGVVIGLVAVSSLFQISILGVTVPRPFGS